MNNLAIIIPYYKIQFFRETLLSLEAQTDKRFQLYIGNDASPDDPLPTIKETLTIPYQYYNYAENIGGKNLAEQWERILHETGGNFEWFMILGDDDMLSPNFVEEFYKNLPEINSNQCNVIKYAQYWVDEKGKRINENTEFPKLFSRLENWKKKFVTGERASLSEHIFRTSEFKKHGFQKFPLAWGSDDAAVFDVAGASPLYFIHTAQVMVRVSPESISGSTDKDGEKKAAHHYFEKYMINHHYKNLEKEDIYKMINQQISYSYKNNLSLRINLYKIYWYFKDITQIKKSFKTYFYLNQIRKKQK